ncbi:Polycomb group protein EMBRYONIC FLOWER 2 [Rhynchospora pubera]|uniref:Polycomb group protein EMBRYONIC FLOWER 2 n=1 Tax=Rhynchospora pubera TaxID=906938 RepID=A0AAV8EXN5_9POAL|nr:Polycomb group protein EMBRYONIC FLOWER 2 [Rhynchospora pubera]
MPGLPLAVRETTNLGCSCSHSSTDQMCRQQSRSHLTAEEQLAAEESFSLYCKPVELYNILQRRATRNPYFLQRCLLYKTHAKLKKRIQVSVSLSSNLNEAIQSRTIFPIYVLLARPLPEFSVGEQTASYRLNRVYMLTSFFEIGDKDRTEASFVIPDLQRLATDSRANNLHIIIVSTGEREENIIENGKAELGQPSSLPNLEGKCYWGSIPISLLSSSMENCVTLSLGHKAEMVSAISMHPSYLEPKFIEHNNRVTFHAHKEDASGPFHLQVNLSAVEVGANERTPYDSYSYENIPASSLPHIMRLRAGNVLFNYRYYNNTLQRTEVTEDFACPFCLVQCGSFKGLKCHLVACHDLFKYEFLVTEEYQAVNVSVKTDVWRSELVAEGVDPRLQTFFYCSRYRRQRRLGSMNKRKSRVHLHAMDSNSPDETLAWMDGDFLQKDNGTCSSHGPVANSHSLAAQLSMTNDTAQTLAGSNLTPPTVLQFGKTRKLSVERADPRNRALLQKRQFFHSHRAQPMALEQVFSDRDSEDEVDDDIADFEDRRMLDDFVDVTKDEKQIMHLWNSFVRKQRVLADGHIPWACEAFSRIHGKDFERAPSLLWCWRLFMIKLWNHSLLDARTMNNCSLILQCFKNENPDPK